MTVGRSVDLRAARSGLRSAESKAALKVDYSVAKLVDLKAVSLADRSVGL